MNDVTLFSLADDYAHFQNKLITSLGELTEDDEQNEERINKALVEKTDNVAKFVNFTFSEEDRIKNEIETLQKHLKVIGNGRERFIKYAATCMDKMKVSKIEGSEYVIKKKKPTKIVQIDDPNKLPIDLISSNTVTTTTPDKKAIKQRFKDGHEVKGAKMVDGKISFKFERKK